MLTFVKGIHLTRGSEHLIEKTMRLNYLLDFYHALLTPKQREYMQMYYFEDYSLVEIAENANVSRQAVYDNIKRTEAILETYEEKIHLYEKFLKRKSLFEQLEQQMNGEKKEQTLPIIEQLKELG